MFANQSTVLWSLTAMFIAFLSASEARAEYERCFDYEDTNKMVSYAQGLRSQYVRLKATVTIENPRLTMAEVKLRMKRDKKTVMTLPIAADGSVKLPPIDKALAERTQLCFNQKKGAAGLMVKADIRPPTKKHVRYRDLFVLLDDFNGFINEMAGFMSWFISDMDALAFTFKEPATIEVLSQQRPKTFATSSKFVIEIEHDDVWQKENPLLKFSAPATEMEPRD